MNWLGVIKLSLTLIMALVTMLRDKKLVDSAQAEVVLKKLEESNEVLAGARKERDSAVDEHRARDGVPDESDPNLRD